MEGKNFLNIQAEKKHPYQTSTVLPYCSAKPVEIIQGGAMDVLPIEP